MKDSTNYHEEAKRIFLELNRDNISSEETGKISDDEYGDTLNALFVLSEVVNTQYSKIAIERRGIHVFGSREYYQGVIDQLYIFLNNTMDNVVIGIKEEVIPSKEAGYKIISKLEDLLN